MLEFYSQSPDWVKAAIVIGLPALGVAIFWIVMWYRVQMARIGRDDMTLG